MEVNGFRGRASAYTLISSWNFIARSCGDMLRLMQYFSS